MSELSRRRPLLVRSALRGAAAGVLGVAAMTAGEKLEQSLTRRPNSYVPGRALLTLVGRRAPDRAEPLVANHLLHWATGATLGALRGVWSVVGLRGPRANLAHTVVRLSFDQTVENVRERALRPTPGRCTSRWSTCGTRPSSPS